MKTVSKQYVCPIMRFEKKKFTRTRKHNKHVTVIVPIAGHDYVHPLCPRSGQYSRRYKSFDSVQIGGTVTVNGYQYIELDNIDGAIWHAGHSMLKVAKAKLGI